ncbi:UbiD family decarboxylase [Natrarchaeobius oligotrophus]|uniref:UbiD family decarboxylase n=1 Tax=Natrarchaeobius chitinivorans TaxID=1679083 RepID=A0A3N6MWG7_NATCH|nr:UbiD family decarboxylase [Natrarchaeobius chitinivorans]RQH02311.1 UbiD family decarboxylase [Natrarchaeobius chitinivorans]
MARENGSRDLRKWIDQVDEVGSLQRIGEEVDWDEEMGAITYVSHKKEGAPALLFENIKDYPEGYRVLFNIFSSSTERLAVTMNEDPGLDERQLIQKARSKLTAREEPTQVDPADAPIFENTDTGEDVDLWQFPVPKMWPGDGGRFIGTADLTITRNPDTGELNMGTYRQMIHNENQTGLFTSPGKDLRLHLQKQWAKGEPLEVVAVYGVQPELFLASQLTFGEDVSELEIAGGVRGSPIEMVEGEITDLPIPANAEIAVEGKMYPGETKTEGPFGEFTGYYGRPEDDAEVNTVEAIHYRDDPILTCALMADYPGCDINLTYSVGRSARIWNDLESLGLPGVESVYTHPAGASGMAMTVVSIDQQYAGHAKQAATLAAQCPGGAYFSKFIVVVDDDVNPADTNQVIWALATRWDAERHTDLLTDTWSTPLDPSRNPADERPYGSQLIIDATKEHKYMDEFPPRTAIREEMYEEVVDRWDELGFDYEPPSLPIFYGETGSHGDSDEATSDESGDGDDFSMTM